MDFKDLNIKQIKIWDLISYEFNNKNHPERQINLLINSIKEFWFNTPLIIDKDKVIIAWHGRCEAAKKLWLEKVPCIIKDDLTDLQIKKYRLLDNKIAELAEDNKENIKIELQELENMELNDLYNLKIDLNTNLVNNDWTNWDDSMPEYLTEDTSYRKFIVHFNNESEVQEFCKKLNIEVTDKTKVIWFNWADKERFTTNL